VEDGIRVQNKNIFAAACTNACIVAPSKTEILLVLHNADLRIVVANKFNGIVNGTVVRDYDFEVRRMRPIVNRTQAITDYPEIVPTDNYDREFHQFDFRA
jgi:hypothetical protein